ncbi:hypothetical protein PHK61_10405 [Actinomycetospora lutea]|uniref:hypothetical protein n=1 Tax=Actinomycetospora lutea TaxID=663604 RepID=UPI002365FB5F|nr:hypothetical protein [Actinomycetospora lutea]MDD7938827.1 hypothetical protein [Actinomycetospora lutea]
MTAHALADFPTAGFDHFRQAFRDALDDGPARECREARVFHGSGDDEDGRVVVLLSFDDTDALARFRAEIEKDVASGGDMAPPVFTELTEDDDLVTRTSA